MKSSSTRLMVLPVLSLLIVAMLMLAQALRTLPANQTSSNQPPIEHMDNALDRLNDSADINELVLDAADPAAEADAESAAGSSINELTLNEAVVDPILEPTPVSAVELTIEAMSVGGDTYQIFAQQLNANWNDWSYGVEMMGVTGPEGRPALQLDYIDAHGAVQWSIPEDLYGEDYSALSFALHGGESGGQLLKVALIDGGGNWKEIAPITLDGGRWQTYEVPLSDYGSPDYVAGVIIQDIDGLTPRDLYLADVELVRQPVEMVRTGPTLRVDIQGSQHNINPLIYGANFVTNEQAADLNLTLNRWGGNAVTRYNWRLDVSNRASDWYFMNIANEVPNLASLPDSAGFNNFIRDNEKYDMASILTMPLIGWTPSSRRRDCGFAVVKYGAQRNESADGLCGDGVNIDNEPIVNNMPGDTSTAITESFVIDWMQYLIDRYGTAADGGVQFYSLDNEPMLWHHTHRDVHPNPVTYDEIWQRSKQYATAIKATDPTAATLGPAVWGWSAYFYSAEDVVRGDWVNPRDRQAHDDLPFLEWYLQQMAAEEARSGTRLLDYLDVHYYPQGAGVALSPAGGLNTQAHRLRSTRSLWDPTYIDESWINEPVQLVPRLHGWVRDNYPDTKIALTEYNFGAMEHINGALTQAEVLGIFGREQLDMATLWDPPAPDQPGAFAFRMYRNYDGNGGRFGDRSLLAGSDDPDTLSVFAAERSTDGALTLVVINKTRYDLSSRLELAGMTAGRSAELYRYSETNLNAVETVGMLTTAEGSLDATFTPYSITTIIIAP